MKNLIELSLLPRDTGKPDVFSASPEPPLPTQEERKGGAEGGLKGEEKSQKKKEKNQKRQEEPRLSSQKKEPQKSQRGGQGKRECQESESEQVSPPPGSTTPHLTHKKCLRSELQLPSLL